MLKISIIERNNKKIHQKFGGLYFSKLFKFHYKNGFTTFLIFGLSWFSTPKL